MLLNGLSFSPFRGCFGQVLFSPVFDYGFQKRCKGVHCVDLGESFPTSIYLQNLASIQPRTSRLKLGWIRSLRIVTGIIAIMGTEPSYGRPAQKRSEARAGSTTRTIDSGVLSVEMRAPLPVRNSVAANYKPALQAGFIACEGGKSAVEASARLLFLQRYLTPDRHPGSAR